MNKIIFKLFQIILSTFKEVLQSFAELNEFMGVSYYAELEKKYGLKKEN